MNAKKINRDAKRFAISQNGNVNIMANASIQKEVSNVVAAQLVFIWTKALIGRSEYSIYFISVGK